MCGGVNASGGSRFLDYFSWKPSNSIRKKRRVKLYREILLQIYRDVESYAFIYSSIIFFKIEFALVLKNFIFFLTFVFLLVVTAFQFKGKFFIFRLAH